MKKSPKELENRINEEVGKIIVGKSSRIKLITAAILSQGHVLLDDLPGVGKTTLVKSLAKALGCDSKRIQFTPDMLPSDITGMNIYDRQSGQFRLLKGPVVTNLLLADELNRATSRTQSALLEAMEEGQVTVDDKTYPLPKPFVVIATQNPFGSSGTQKLPESQLDRFMIRLSMGYPDHENAVGILKGNVGSVLEELAPVLSGDQVREMRKKSSEVFVHDNLFDYLVTLTENTRKNDYFITGLSPRASLSLLKMAKATAYMEGAEFVLPEHILHNLHEVSVHRLNLSPRAKASGMTVDKALDEIAASTPLPKV